MTRSMRMPPEEPPALRRGPAGAILPWSVLRRFCLRFHATYPVGAVLFSAIPL